MERGFRTEKRKYDTRRKIAIGALAVRAGLADEPQEVLLGALLDIARRLAADQSERSRLTKIGQEAWGGRDD